MPSCEPRPSLLGSEASGDHSMKTGVAGGTCMGAHTVAPHQRECTCCVVGGSVNFIVSCSNLARARISFREITPFANISKQNARPRIRRRMLFVVITLMRTLHAFDLGNSNEIQSLCCEASQSVAEKRPKKLHVVRHTVGCPSISSVFNVARRRRSKTCSSILVQTRLRASSMRQGEPIVPRD